MQHGGHITKDLLGPRGAPVGGGGDTGLVITDFTQALGAELVTNGDFSAWTADNPDNWAVGGETGADLEVTERAPTALHADAVGVGGAANLYNSADAVNWHPIILQTIMTVGLWYELTCVFSAYAAGKASIRDNSGGIASDVTSAVTARGLGRSKHANLRIGPRNGSPTNFTVNSVSAKKITLNAQQVMSADALVEFFFTPPVAPAAGDTIHLFYRIADADLETGFTCWDAYLRRNAANNAWDFRLDSVNTGTATNRINVTGVGTVTGLRVTCVGTKHNCYTYDGATWTKRGSEINVSHNDDSTGVNTVYSSAATPSRLTVWPS